VVRKNPDIRYSIMGSGEVYDHLSAEAKVQGSEAFQAIADGLLTNARMLPPFMNAETNAGKLLYAMAPDFVVLAVSASTLTEADLVEGNPIYMKSIQLLSLLLPDMPMNEVRQYFSYVFVAKGVNMKKGPQGVVDHILHNISQLHHLMVDMSKVDYELIRKSLESARRVLWSL